MNWVPYNEHDELVRAMAQIDELKKEIELLREELAEARKTEHTQRDGSSLKMTSLQTPEGGKVRRAFSFNPMMKYARGYFDER